MTTTATATHGICHGPHRLNVSDLARARISYRAIFGFEGASESSEPGREFVFLGQPGVIVLTSGARAAGPSQGPAGTSTICRSQVDSIDRVRERSAVSWNAGR